MTPTSHPSLGLSHPRHFATAFTNPNPKSNDRLPRPVRPTFASASHLASCARVRAPRVSGPFFSVVPIDPRCAGWFGDSAPCLRCRGAVEDDQEGVEWRRCGGGGRGVVVGRIGGRAVAFRKGEVSGPGFKAEVWEEM